MRILTALFIVASLAAEGADELNLLRGIAAAGQANLSDLCDLVLLQRGDIAKYPQKKERCKVVTDLKIYNLAKIAIPLIEPVTAGAAAKAAIQAHALEKSLLFKLTGFEWYAVQNAEELGLLPAKTPVGKVLSGEELLAVFEKAMLLANERENWGKPENPYAEFGVNTYQELNEAYDKASKEK